MRDGSETVPQVPPIHIQPGLLVISSQSRVIVTIGTRGHVYDTSLHEQRNETSVLALALRRASPLQTLDNPTISFQPQSGTSRGCRARLLPYAS